MAELRPWKHAPISVAEFAATRELRIVDLTARTPAELADEHSLAQVFNPWMRLDEAFSTPVEPTVDFAHYAPTQVVAELVGREYDGIAYRSSIASGKCFALFDRSVVAFIRAGVFEARQISYTFVRTMLVDEFSGDPDEFGDERWF
jgi:hypothetical protein